MKTYKTPTAARNTYKLYNDDGEFVTEYKPGKDGVTAADIAVLHKIDDHEVYISQKENRLPEWYQPIYDEWKVKFIAEFEKKHGRTPHKDEIPGRFRMTISIDAQIGDDGEEMDECSKLEEELAVSDEDEASDAVTRMREVVSEMPEQWQKVYKMVCLGGMSKAEAGRKIGISDVRVGKIVKKVTDKIAADPVLKKCFR